MSYSSFTENDHIYYDLLATSNDHLGSSIPQTQLTFNEIRSNPYINDPEEYYCSIVRFKVETGGISLPQLIPQMDTDQSEVAGNESVNRLIYTISMRYGNNQFQQAVYFTPQNVNVPVPTSFIIQDNTNGYYNLNSYQLFIDMINKAFENCLAGLNAMAVIGNNIRPPFLQIDPNTFSIQLFGQETYYNDSLVNYVKVYLNESLYNILSSFQVYYEGSNVLQTSGLTIREATQSATVPAVPASIITNVSKARYQLRFYYNTPRNKLNSFTVDDAVVPYNNNLPVANSYPYTAITMFQEYTSLNLLCPIQSILFTSSLLPIATTLTGKPAVFNSQTTTVQSGNNSNIVLQISDLTLENTTGKDYKPCILYSPTAEYRLNDLYGNAPLHQIDIQVYWKDRYGNIYPLYLTPSSTASIKILFRKKKFNSVKE